MADAKSAEGATRRVNRSAYTEVSADRRFVKTIGGIAYMFVLADNMRIESIILLAFTLTLGGSVGRKTP
jgi:hypothetical protein